MESPLRDKAEKRLAAIAGLMVLWGLAIFFRLFSLQVWHHADYARMAQQQQEQEVEIVAPRGSIFDRTGALLAKSVPMESVFIDPLHVPDLQVAAEILSGILGLDRATLFGRMQMYFNHHKGYMWVAHRIQPQQAERLHSLKLEWIRFVMESKRDYPKGARAAHVIGSVDSEENGAGGLEQSLDADLRGLPGTVRVLTDAQHRGIDSHTETEPRPGVPLTITIDERIQFTAEQELARAVVDAHAESGSTVVMDPHSGDILAMASYPTFDPSRPPTRKEDPAVRFNHAVSVPFEPGSVFKVITLSAALETTDLRPESMINCGNGVLRLPGRIIHEAHQGYGTIPMAMVLAKSSNIGAIQIGMRVGQNKLYEYVRRFGFGSRTGMPLPGESPGIVRKLSRWGTTSLSSVAMGHEVGVTTLQLAQACSAVANGGLLVAPRLILRKGEQAVPAVSPRRILDPATTITMRQMMEGVVLFGTGKRARLEGYSTAGKTGSAQIYDFAGRHYTHSYNASFMGIAPVSNPAIVVVVTLNGTHGSAGFGGAVAAPVFKVIAQEALRVLDVPKDLPDTPEVPDNQVADLNDVAIADLGSKDPVLLEDPAEVAEATEGPKVPNFGGLSKRAVVAKAQSEGLQVLLVGMGTAAGQEPRPGSPLREGERIRVEFAR